jgi:hypothetical protein
LSLKIVGNRVGLCGLLLLEILARQIGDLWTRGEVDAGLCALTRADGSQAFDQPVCNTHQRRAGIVTETRIDHAWVQRVHGHARVLQTTGERVAEKHVHQLGLKISAHATVAALVLNVVPFDLALRLCTRGDVDDPSIRRGFQQIQEQIAEQEVRQVIERERVLETFAGGLTRIESAACVVDQYLELIVLGFESLRDTFP